MDAWTIAKGILLAVAILVLTPLMAWGAFLGTRALVNRAREWRPKQRITGWLKEPEVVLGLIFLAMLGGVLVIAILQG